MLKMWNLINLKVEKTSGCSFTLDQQLEKVSGNLNADSHMDALFKTIS